jgi:hypothetical protein
MLADLLRARPEQVDFTPAPQHSTQDDPDSRLKRVLKNYRHLKVPVIFVGAKVTAGS